jgi:hypothetical protein
LASWTSEEPQHSNLIRAGAQKIGIPLQPCIQHVQPFCQPNMCPAGMSTEI